MVKLKYLFSCDVLKSSILLSKLQEIQISADVYYLQAKDNSILVGAIDDSALQVNTTLCKLEIDVEIGSIEELNDGWFVDGWAGGRFQI